MEHGTRTHDKRVMSSLLYLAELEARKRGKPGARYKMLAGQSARVALGQTIILRLFPLAGVRPSGSLRAVSLGLLGAAAFLTIVAASSALAETEPNNDIAHADAVFTDVAMDGAVNRTSDFADYFSITGVRGDYIRVRVAVATSQPPLRSVATTNGSTSLVEWEPEGNAFETSWLLAEGTTLYFRVLVDEQPTRYAISANITASGLYGGAGPSVAQLIALPNSGVVVHPKNQPPFVVDYRSTTGSFNLATGEGMLFGETLCLETDIQNGIQGVAVRAGELYKPHDPELQEMVASRTMTFNVAPGGLGCFSAMSRTTSGYLGRVTDYYDPSGMVGGESLAMMNLIDQRRADGASGQLALWAVTSGTDEDEAKSWGASSNTIANARALLNAAKLQTPLNPDYSWVGPVGGAVIVVLIASVLGYFIRRDRLAKRAPPPPPAPNVNAWRPPPPPGAARGGTAGVAASWGARSAAPPPPPPSPPYTPTYLCPRCGSALQAGRPVCPRCGLPL